jgi:transcriptional antiterminator RfaH
MRASDLSAIPEALDVLAAGSLELSWYCARTKPKNEHIASAHIRKNLGLEVFNPALRREQRTVRGVVKRVTEPLFPCYIFVRCVIGERLDQIRHTSGVSSIVNFGQRIPVIPEPVILELQQYFGTEEPLPVDTCPRPGDEVTLTTKAFFGMDAVVLQSWPAKRRVQVLLDILGRPTKLDVDCGNLTLHQHTAASFVPALAAAKRA